MFGSINRVQLLGRVGKDPETKTFQGGGKVLNLTVATSETWKDKVTGEKKEKTEWHRVTIHNQTTIEYAEQNVTKGAMVFIEGAIETRKWTNSEGKDQYSTEITVRPYSGNLILLNSSKQGGTTGNTGTSQGYQSQPTSQRQSHTAQHGRGGHYDQSPTGAGGQYGSRGLSAKAVTELDDDIPF